MPATDVFARDGKSVIRFELPGIDPETEVAVTLEEGERVVRGERIRKEEAKEEDHDRLEARGRPSPSARSRRRDAGS